MVTLPRARLDWRPGLIGRLVIGVSFLMNLAAEVFDAREMKSSREQARHISRLASDLTWDVEPGASQDIRFPEDGPYDVRHGYVGIPTFVELATARGFTVEAQARWSERMRELTDKGLFTTYWEKTRAGLVLMADDDEPMYDARRLSSCQPSSASQASQSASFARSYSAGSSGPGGIEVLSRAERAKMRALQARASSGVPKS